MLTLRLWRPLAHDAMEVWSWFLVEKDAPEEFKQASYDTYVRTFGVSGVLEQDDAEIWRLITRGTQGELCGGQDLNFEMGLGVIGEQPNWPGPGRALAERLRRTEPARVLGPMARTAQRRLQHRHGRHRRGAGGT